MSTQNENLPHSSDAGSGLNTLPSVSLPKGGGAIRGLGEKFAANPVTGSGATTVPIATSPGRSGFGPQLSLAYESAAGNGPFGFGWNLSLPAITRKTDKGLPRYEDASESDVFILSGAEDLVPVCRKDNNENWVRDQHGNPVVHEDIIDGYRVRRYRPRTEGLFARIERWTPLADLANSHWRSISKDNILTLYGANENSRICDPEDPTRIFSWLICETRDDRGNAVLYEHKKEDGVGANLAQAHERARGDIKDPRRQANSYLKRIYYGNRSTLLDDSGRRPRHLTKSQIDDADWMFEVVLDYGDHNPSEPEPRDDEEMSGEFPRWPWLHRRDSFSSYRAGFEIRTARRCKRVLMFHHFAAEPGVGRDCLVRSTDFAYSSELDPDGPIYSFLRSVTQTSYRRTVDSYRFKSLPPIEFEYSRPTVHDVVEEVDAESLENLPIGVEGSAYQWTDLHGEGIPGILTEQAGTWFFKRNLSPISEPAAKFGSMEIVAAKPSLDIRGGQAQFMDLAGDGLPDLVVMDGPVPGFYEHDEEDGWRPYEPFTSRLNFETQDPNLRFVDLNGDGRADVLITEDQAFVWHSSLGEEGFGPAQQVTQSLDEEKGPRLVFNESTQSIYVADLSGDGLSDLVRIRNGEICYWPNLGYGRFGAKVTMDNAPVFDHPDQFDQKRIRLADIDGSGTTDIIYLHAEGVRLYFNQSGNSWSEPQQLKVFPALDSLSSIVLTDLLGNGTACLVWSSPLPQDLRRSLRYVNLMGRQKPHLLVKTINNLGSETLIQYAPSIKFYLQDKRDGKPWITRLPFPVHVVEIVETIDHISRNRFVTRYAYHHGCFDGDEREFRGFGMVEQWDTETIGTLAQNPRLADETNIDPSSHVPPVLTKSWFHTGAYLGRDHISNFFAGLTGEYSGEYYRERLTDEEAASLGLDDHQRRQHDDTRARALLLDDTELPRGLSFDEERQACRALKGSLLRQEVYALDGTGNEAHPYTVLEQNFSVRQVQPRGRNRHAVFFSHPRETITYHYERNPADPRTQHALTIEVDNFGNVLKQATVGYGRRKPESLLQLQLDQDKQIQMLVTYSENRVTHAIDNGLIDDYRAPLPCEARTYELTGHAPLAGERFQLDDFANVGQSFSEINYEDQATNGKQRRLIEHLRTLYRPDDLGSSQNDRLALLPIGEIQPRAIPGETYKLSLTAGLAQSSYVDNGKLTTVEVAAVFTSGGYVHSEGDTNWWIPSGRIFYSNNSEHTAAEELAQAQGHFFLPRRFRNPFHTDAIRTESFADYDAYDLLLVETRDALDNITTVRTESDARNKAPRIDYRVLQPYWLTEPNGNRTRVVFDILGLVAGTAVMGKPGENLGDFLDDFETDPLDEKVLLEHIDDPLTNPEAILSRATSRLVYDLFAYHRTKNSPNPQPVVTYTLLRETHVSDPLPPGDLKFQHSFSYSDGFGREIQKKLQAEPEKIGGDVGPPRWVGSGWTIFNNKGNPVRKYEPFFSDTHRFKFEAKAGVSPVLFYDPLGRVVATLHPNQTWEKVIFSPWQQATFDVNDTVLNDDGTTDPKRDQTVSGFFSRLAESEYLPTWYEQRISLPANDPERIAAEKAAIHRQTPTIAYFDTLGRTFLTVAQNRFNHNDAIVEERYPTRVELDIEGNQRTVRDAIEQAGDAQGRIVMRYDYDMLGNRIHQSSMEAGERWTLNDVTGKPIYAWDSRGHAFRTEYDPLRRPLRLFVKGADPADSNRELLTERLVYGEQHPQAETRNLRGKPFLHLDQAGAVMTDANDFKGNTLQTSRRLTSGNQYRQTVDWTAANSDPAAFPADSKSFIDLVSLDRTLGTVLETEVFRSATTYDALNRATQLIPPRSSQSGTRRNVIQPRYNEANLLEAFDVWLDYASRPDGLLDPAAEPPSLAGVSNIDYDAKGRRVRIKYKNETVTAYDYDRLSFRLTNLKTTRPVVATGPSQIFGNPSIQDLRYTYDPAGNITLIEDAALATIFHNNEQVDPVCEYEYDAAYRLISAKGREHIGQTAHDFDPPDHNRRDYPFAGLAEFNIHANDGQAMRNYTETYEYDSVGNFMTMRHVAHGGSWTRNYDYLEVSLIEGSKRSNRLTRTTIGNGGNRVEEYRHDVHGNMIRMSHLGGADPDPNLDWNYRDQLSEVDMGGGGTAYYVYDSSGQRVRKVCERSANLTEERIYLGGFEIYRRQQSGQLLERETLHVMDDKQRIALVETRTADTAAADQSPRQLIRYQFSNHLGSSSLELDETAQLISYEEYTPYGSTSYQTMRGQGETPKRYRYTGKERDEESGLYYHGARHYGPWLGRWTSTDPARNQEGPNLFAYVSDNPIGFSDPTGNAKFEAREGYFFDQNMAHYKTEIAKEQMRAARGTPQFEEAKARFAAAVDAEFVANEAAESRRIVGNVAMALPLIPVMATPPGMVIGAASTGVGIGEALTGKEVKSFNPASDEFGKTTKMNGMSRLENVGWAGSEAVPGLGRVLKGARAEARAARTATRTQGVVSGAGDFVDVPGIKFDPKLSEPELQAWELSLEDKVEYATVNGKSPYTSGLPREVRIYSNEPVQRVSHTHPLSGIPRPSEGDVLFAAKAALSPDTVHRIIGFKYPNTNAFLASEGLEICKVPIAGEYSTEMARQVTAATPRLKLNY